MKINQVTDKAFHKYGRVVTGIDFTELVETMQNTPCDKDVVYLPSVNELEALQYMRHLRMYASESSQFR